MSVSTTGLLEAACEILNGEKNTSVTDDDVSVSLVSGEQIVQAVLEDAV